MNGNLDRSQILKTVYHRSYLLFGLAVLLLTFLVRHHVFFWDTIQLGSKHAHWFYENNFQYFLLPTEIDSGHPPFFGIYLAALWKAFGQSLPVSHFAMLPFLFGIVWSLYRIGVWLVDQRFAFFLLLLVFVDPVIAGQMVLVSPDIVLFCFFLLLLWSILSENKALKIIAVLGLSLISMRGWMVAASLFIFEVFNSQKELSGSNGASGYLLFYLKKGIQKLPPYLPGGLLALSFLLYHYKQTGWIGYHADSPWAPSFERVDFKGLLYNIAVLGWRFLDFGRVFIWLAILPVIYLLWKEKRKPDDKIRCLFLLFIVLSLGLIPSQITHKYLVAHRYLLPLLFSFSLLFLYGLHYYLPGRSTLQKIIYCIALFGLTTGNAWIYPKQISQAWDSTLAHLPHYELRAEVWRYIEKNDIPPEQIGTAFPEIGPLKFKDLSGQQNGFSSKDFSTQRYILYSNIMNDYTDKEIQELEEEGWRIMVEFRKRGICYVLYERNY